MTNKPQAAIAAIVLCGGPVGCAALPLGAAAEQDVRLWELERDLADIRRGLEQDGSPHAVRLTDAEADVAAIREANGRLEDPAEEFLGGVAGQGGVAGAVGFAGLALYQALRRRSTQRAMAAVGRQASVRPEHLLDAEARRELERGERQLRRKAPAYVMPSAPVAVAAPPAYAASVAPPPPPSVPGHVAYPGVDDPDAPGG